MLFLVTALFLSAATPAAESLDGILAKNSQARGGYQTWKAVGSARMHETMTLSDGARVPVMMDSSAPIRSAWSSNSKGSLLVYLVLDQEFAITSAIACGAWHLKEGEVQDVPE